MVPRSTHMVTGLGYGPNSGILILKQPNGRYASTSYHTRIVFPPNVLANLALWPYLPQRPRRLPPPPPSPPPRGPGGPGTGGGAPPGDGRERRRSGGSWR
eukprot:1191389-Prorocentrum_minimum.AAC.3